MKLHYHPLSGHAHRARLFLSRIGAGFNAVEVIARAHGILKVLDAELTTRDWIAADHPTIADVALYSYTARAPEGNVSLDAYPAVQGWLKRIAALRGFLAFVNTPVGVSIAA